MDGKEQAIADIEVITHTNTHSTIYVRHTFKMWADVEFAFVEKGDIL